MAAAAANERRAVGSAARLEAAGFFPNESAGFPYASVGSPNESLLHRSPLQQHLVALYS